MSTIKASVWNAILYNNHPAIVQEAQATSPDTRRWVAIYSLKTVNKRGSYMSWDIFQFKNAKYCIIDFEVDRKLVGEYRDGLGDEDLQHLTVHYANSEEEIYGILEAINIKPEAFGHPWHCEYPL